LLHEILIPNAVKMIKDVACQQCTQLSSVVLGKGLEERSGRMNFVNLHCYMNMTCFHAANWIKVGAFLQCSQLTTAGVVHANVGQKLVICYLL
jgi:hypothetical protein